MPEHDVCVAPAELVAGASIGLAACDGSDLQRVLRSGEGRIGPASDPALCFTAGGDTRVGRGGTSQHRIKDLTLEPCSEDLAAYQTWRTRTGDD